MPRNKSILSSDYIIENFSNDITNKDRKTTTTISGDSGVKIVTFNGEFSSAMTSQTLRISDGVTTINYQTQDTEGANASDADRIGIGGGRGSDVAVDEFVSKINSSALDISANDDGGDFSSASMTLTPGAGKTITITEQPGGDGIFGDSAAFTVVTDGGSDTVSDHEFALFRFLSKGSFNLRGQSDSNPFESFIGNQKS
tara:strand:+ start:827 stop:1423 length:597 start_codon:yes stop_codon:yes gene_type:complete